MAQGRLADARQVLDQQVPPCQEATERQADLLLFAEQNSVDGVDRLRQPFAPFLGAADRIFARVVNVEGGHGEGSARALSRAAQMKSFSDRPPIACVV